MNKTDLRKLILEYVDEALTLSRQDDKLVVGSDLETREDRSKETFRNKDKLKAAGFRWNGEAWTISSDKFDVARQTLMKLNKVESFIEKIEDLPEFIQNSENMGRKQELTAKIEGFIKNLTTELDEKAASDEIRNFLAFQAKLRKRSIHNTLLIYIQNKNATHVEGFNVWRDKFGRQVRKGAKAITIFAPITAKRKDDEGDDSDLDNQVKKQNTMYFRPVSVFDISDTDPIPGKEHLYAQKPEWHADDSPNEKADKITSYASKLASELGINITGDAAMGGEMGFAAGDHINITSNVAGVNKAGTLIHEIAHELLHFKKGSIFHIDDENATKQDKEIQAETVSYIVLRHYDLPAQHQSTYLALWRANKDGLQKNLGKIKQAADFVIKNIDEIAAEDPENKTKSGDKPTEMQENEKDASQLFKPEIKYDKDEVTLAVSLLSKIAERIPQGRIQDKVMRTMSSIRQKTNVGSFEEDLFVKITTGNLEKLIKFLNKFLQEGYEEDAVRGTKEVVEKIHEKMSERIVDYWMGKK
jgi:hypothetical protein